jgi:hypothetical protein
MGRSAYCLARRRVGDSSLQSDREGDVMRRSHEHRTKRSRSLWAVAAAATGCAFLVVAATAGAITAEASFGDGTYRVGKDIRAGTYRARGHGGNECYWARLRSFSGSVDAIIANENLPGPAVVTILRRDKGFETRGCGNWTSKLRRLTKSKTRFGQGTYIVGTDMVPGTYRSRGGTYCYWARLRAFTGTGSAIIANDNPSGSAIVTIKRSDKGFTSNGCGIWRR